MVHCPRVPAGGCGHVASVTVGERASNPEVGRRLRESNRRLFSCCLLPPPPESHTLCFHHQLPFDAAPPFRPSSALAYVHSLTPGSQPSVHPPFLPFNNILPHTEATVVDTDLALFAEILQGSCRPWRINKLPPDEEKCRLLLSRFPQAPECNFTLIMLL